MAISQDDATALVNDEAGGVTSTGGFGIEGATRGGSENDDGGDHFVKSLTPVVGGGYIFSQRRV